MFQKLEFYKKVILLVVTSFIVVVLLILSASYYFLEHRQPAKEAVVSIDAVNITVEVADNEYERMRGLSGTESLGQNEGMLFLFPENVVPLFWMKDMNYPIDIIWIDDSLKITGISRNVRPDTYPQQFSPDTPVKYVLEVNGGFSERYGITPGQSIRVNNLNK